MKSSYLTIDSMGEGLYKEKGSKFIGYAYPIRNKKEVTGILEAIRKDHPKSRHVCYAYKLGIENPEYKSYDDGEPSGTAGQPILSVIENRELTNVLMAVVRYFGGTLLGASGLVRAYKRASNEALENIKIRTKFLRVSYELIFDYGLEKDINLLIKQEDIKILESKYDTKCQLTVGVKVDQEERIRIKFNSVQNLTTKKL
ncbi:MAG: YigZ family protein [Bacteroidetes bacterium]|nr:YigZ family protein [Bacteroidota bacterium]